MKKLCCILISIVVLTSLVPVSVFANEEMKDGFFTYTVNENSITITDCDEEASGDVRIPYEINGIPVEHIGDYAFSSCSKITRLLLPNIKTIGCGAFAYCEALEKITFSDSLEMIKGCHVMHITTGQDNYEYFMGLPSATFYYCKSLKNVYFQGDNTKIEGTLFIDCPNLSYVKLPDNLSEPLSEYEFLSKETVGQQKYVFTDYPSKLKIGKTENEIIKSFCLEKGFKMAEIYYSDGQECHGEFQWYNGFAYVVLDESAKTAILVDYDREIIIGEELVIPTEINDYKITGFADRLFNNGTFKKCDLRNFPVLSYSMFANSLLEEIILSPQTKEIPPQCFFGTKIKTVELPEGLEVIGEDAFRESTIEEVAIPSTVKEIGENAFTFCNNLKKIEIKEGVLSSLKAMSDGYASSFSAPNLETLIIPPSITFIDDYEFKELHVAKAGYSVGDYPKNLTVYGAPGSYAESFARIHGFNFTDNANWESKTKNPYVMARLEKESFTFFVNEIIDTEYGTVLYYDIGGMPHGPYTRFLLVDYDGNEYWFEGDPIPADTVYGRIPGLENLEISDDGRYLTFSVSFADRLIATLGDTPQKFHDAGTYYFKCDLKEHTRVETHFEPLDIMGEDEISTWAKPEIEKAIELGFVPISLRENYRKNITRAEFAKMAMYFLSVQYGYQPEHIIRTYYNLDKEFPLKDFISAYCTSKKDRNGNNFINNATGEEWKYEDKKSTDIVSEISGTVFSDLDGENIFDMQLIGVAYNFGIVNGVSETAFNPDGDITRQEAAAMLMRVYKNYAGYQNSDTEYLFSDDDTIAAWAKEDVYNVNALGVMQGVGNDIFAPLDGYTVEQAIATFLRLYESAPVSRRNKNIEPLLDFEYEKENFWVNDPGTSSFLTEKEWDFDAYTVVSGTHQGLHRKTDNKLYLFYKYGGVRDLTSFVPVEQDNTSLIEDIKINPEENIITFVTEISDTFCLYNKLNGTEKVYNMGKYSFEINLGTGNIVRIERLK